MAEVDVKSIMENIKEIADDSYVLGIETSILILEKVKNVYKAKKSKTAIDSIDFAILALEDLKKQSIENGCSNF